MNDFDLAIRFLSSELSKDVPVTIIEAGPCPIIQVKSLDVDGYEALQIGFLNTKNNNKPLFGHLKAANITNGITVLKSNY